LHVARKDRRPDEWDQPIAPCDPYGLGVEVIEPDDGVIAEVDPSTEGAPGCAALSWTDPLQLLLPRKPRRQKSWRHHAENPLHPNPRCRNPLPRRRVAAGDEVAGRRNALQRL
jgi:hypothetical protein